MDVMNNNTELLEGDVEINLTVNGEQIVERVPVRRCLLYTSDAADE